LVVFFPRSKKRNHKEEIQMTISYKLSLNSLVVSVQKGQNEILVDSLYKRSPWTQEEINKIVIKYEEWNNESI